MYKNILIAIDSSEEAKQVVQAAKEISDACGAAVSLITVVTPVMTAYGMEYGMVGSASVDIEKSAAKFAQDQQVQLEKDLDVECEKNVVVGQPATEIRGFAESMNADLIVIGNHGRHGLGLLLGSTANGVLHGAPCSVLVVRLNSE